MKENSYNTRNEEQNKEDEYTEFNTFPFQKTKHSEEAKKYFDSTFSQPVTDKIFSIAKKNQILECSFMVTAVKIMLWKYTSKQNSLIYASINRTTGHLPIFDTINSNLTCSVYLNLIKKKLIQCIENSQYNGIKTNIQKEMIYVVYGEADSLNGILNLANLCHSQVLFYFYKKQDRIMLRIIYGDSINEKDIFILSQCLHYILEQMVHDINVRIKDIELIKYMQRNELANWTSEPVNFDLLDEFRTIVNQNPEKIAICATINIEHILAQFEEKGKKTFENHEELGQLCFQKTKYLYLMPLDSNADSEEALYFIKSSKNYSAILNLAAYDWLESMQGKENLYSMFQFVIRNNKKLIVRRLSCDYQDDGKVVYVDSNCSFGEFLWYVKCLYQMKFIDIVGMNLNNVMPIRCKRLKTLQIIPDVINSNKNVDVVLFGDTPENPTVGLLYLASYLIRNGVYAKCRYKDIYYTSDELEKNIIETLSQYRPKFVGVSMKWFPHIYRALEICRMTKEHFPFIKTVLGGDTASFFYKDLIEFDSVDYIIRGDGEVPLLELCKGNLQGPNIVYKECGNIKCNPISYVQETSNSSDIYLSNLSDILISKDDLLDTTMFVYTHKGCSMNCIYCSGCGSMQNSVFGRKGIYYRDASLVKKDIERLKVYISTLMFDFDLTGNNLLEYCREIWENIDLKEHFCVIFTLELPSRELIEYASRKFKYVRWNIDVCSLSERHRLYMAEKKLVKPQPTDEEIFVFLSICEEFNNIQVDLNQIIGLPFFTKEDIESSNQMLETILRNYPCFNELNWGRLHAQPGTHLAMHAEQYGMLSYANSFKKFYKYSRINYQNEKYYPTLKYYHYPYILYDDAEMNSEISNYYQESVKMINEHARYTLMKKIVWDELSYAELDRKSDMIAVELKKMGVAGEKIVALNLKDPVKLIIAIWGVIKSSAAYLILDTEDKERHIRYMLNHCKVDMLICEKYDVQAYEDINILEFNAAMESDISELKNGSNEVFMGQAVYVIYTSGTMGSPKAVKIKRNGLNNFIRWRKKEYQYLESDNTLQLLSFAFDASAGNLYCSLLSGGTLFVMDSMHRKDPKYIANVIRQKQITNFSTIPSLYQQILNMSEKNDMKSMRFVVLGGEKAQSRLISQSKDQNPNIVLINEYGPSETTITAAYHIGMEPDTTEIIGTPISNTGIYILNQDNNMMPERIAGELCISGQGVADGYLELPEVNAEKFQRDPFRADKTMYRTGDIAFRNAEGSIHLIGRRDNQVKILGYRVECSEVEAVLTSFQFIKEAVVLAYSSETGMLQLVAFFSTYTNTINIDNLKAQLKEALPFYMVPSQFKLMDTLPKMVNGKIDKVALLGCLDNSLRLNTPKGEYTDIELYVLNIWKKVLKINSIGLNDNFFDVGGNSILLMRVYEEIDKLFHGSITVIDLFAYPTIGALSEYLVQKREACMKEEG